MITLSVSPIVYIDDYFVGYSSSTWFEILGCLKESRIYNHYTFQLFRFYRIVFGIVLFLSSVVSRTFVVVVIVIVVVVVDVAVVVVVVVVVVVIYFLFFSSSFIISTYCPGLYFKRFGESRICADRPLHALQQDVLM